MALTGRSILVAFIFTSVDLALAGHDEPQLCFETIGCVMNRHVAPRDAEKLGCDQLWTARNAIFAVRGCCFSTVRGKEEFGNQHCRYANQDAVPLNGFERANVKLFQSIEQRRGC